MGRHRENPADDDYPGHPRSGRARRRRGGAFVALTAAFALLLGLSVTGYYVYRVQDGCGGEDISLDVAVAPELVPALDPVISDFNEADHGVDGRCVTAELRGVDSADVTYGITGTGPTIGDTESDVWIPDSSLWSEMVRAQSGGAPVTDTGTTIASSPLVLAQREKAARKSDEKPSWDALVPTTAPSADADRSAVRLIDPIRSSSGMATLSLVSDTIDDGDGDGGQPQLVAALQALQRGMTPDEEAAFGALSEKSDGPSPLMVFSEQAAWRYNKEHPDTPTRVTYPQGGTHTLDYPYLVRNNDPVASRAAETLRQTLTTEATRDALLAHGFRTPEGVSDTGVLSTEDGFHKGAPEELPTPSTKAVQRLTHAWNQLKLDTRLLTVVDVSGSMLRAVPGTDMNRMEVTTTSAVEGLNMFPPDSELGLWRFSVKINNELDYEELLPIRELSSNDDGGTHKDAIATQLTEMRPVPDGDTGLYDTYLAAYTDMARTYKPDRINSILMLTDGNNDDADSISLDRLLASLKEQSSKQRPIPIFTIAFGPDIDPEPLREISELTGGEAYTTEDPTEIGDIFLRAFSQRLDTSASGEED